MAPRAPQAQDEFRQPHRRVVRLPPEGDLGERPEKGARILVEFHREALFRVEQPDDGKRGPAFVAEAVQFPGRRADVLPRPRLEFLPAELPLEQVEHPVVEDAREPRRRVGEKGSEVHRGVDPLQSQQLLHFPFRLTRTARQVGRVHGEGAEVGGDHGAARRVEMPVELPAHLLRDGDLAPPQHDFGVRGDEIPERGEGLCERC